MVQVTILWAMMTLTEGKGIIGMVIMTSIVKQDRKYVGNYQIIIKKLIWCRSGTSINRPENLFRLKCFHGIVMLKGQYRYDQRGMESECHF